jgi:hypothetical protein
MLTTFLLSAGLISLSAVIPMPIFFTIAGAAGCSFSSVIYIDEMIRGNEEKIFTNCGLINKDKITPKKIDKSIYSIPSGLSFEDVKKKETELSTAFKMPLNAIYNNNYTFTLEELKEVEYIDFMPSALKTNELMFCENVIVDMNKFPHVLIGGDTGTGKSRALLAILTQLINKHDDVDLHLLQVRKNDLGVFKNCKQVKTFSKTLEDVLDCLVALDEELHRRELLIDNFRGIYNIEDYNKRYLDKKLNYAYVVIDEFSFLNVSRGDNKEEKTLKQACLKYIKSIVNVGRSSGVFLITSLQKPTADSIPSDIKSQLVTRVSMRIQDTPTSLVIMGTDEATRLKDRQMIVKTNLTKYGYSYTIEHNIVKKYIKDSVVYRRPKPLKKEQVAVKSDARVELL